MRSQEKLLVYITVTALLLAGFNMAIGYLAGKEACIQQEEVHGRAG